MTAHPSSIDESDSVLNELRGQNVLVVASTGGHLEQAARWYRKLGLAQRSEFITFESPQSESVLADRVKTYIPYIAPRDFKASLRAIRPIVRKIRESGATAILSTGAGVALAAYAASVLTGKPMFFIESVSRFHGPSATGRLLARAPRVRTFTQHSRYASPRWRPVPSLLHSYEVLPAAASECSDAGRESWKIFVTLGTIRPYRFDALVDRVASLLRAGDEVTWQLGATTRDGLPGTSHTLVKSREFDELALNADVVITHAGVGSILRLLDLGVSPIVVPRRRSRNEHVDDHQLQAAQEIDDLGLIDSNDPSEITDFMLHRTRNSVRYRDDGGSTS